ncbi:hypothetical protein WJX64_15395 [Leifsonia sp. YIM 134122]|uniref:IPT/TIG domain-containing protein n=1 Tax=Leifsonia stereocauli TaxID=3134136 RepID=A0ABU9W7F7_9MICO
MRYALEREKSDVAVTALRDNIRSLRTLSAGILYSPPSIPGPRAATARMTVAPPIVAPPAVAAPAAPVPPSAAPAASAPLRPDPVAPVQPGTAAAAAKIAEHTAAISRMHAERTRLYLRHVGRLTWNIVVAIAALLLLAALVVGALGVTPADNRVLPAALAMIAVLLLLSVIALLTRNNGGLITMLIGKDGRFSTSAFQAWVWTVVLAWGFVFVVWSAVLTGRWVDPVQDLASLPLSADYLLLLGGPFAALISAQQIGSAKVASGDLQKVMASAPQVKDLVSNDAGTTDLIDTQYLVFNTVAVVVFGVLLFADPSHLPDLPQAIVILTTASAVGFVSKKAVAKNAPAILTIVPDSGSGVPTVGRKVRIRGTNFIPAGADTEEKRASVWIKFGTVVVSAIETGGVRPALEATEVIVEIPVLPDDGLDIRIVDVVVITAAGAETASYPLQIQTPCAEATLEVGADGRFDIGVESEVPEGTSVRVEVASFVEYVSIEADHHARATVPAGITGPQPVRLSFAGASTKKLVNL